MGIVVANATVSTTLQQLQLQCLRRALLPVLHIEFPAVRQSSVTLNPFIYGSTPSKSIATGRPILCLLYGQSVVDMCQGSGKESHNSTPEHPVSYS